MNRPTLFDRALDHGGPPALHPEVDWAKWIERWEPAYLWHSTARQVAVEVFVISGKKCRVTQEERQDERGRYWVWRVKLA